MSDRYDDAPPVRCIEVARRPDGWITVALDGERVWKRYTRDQSFTAVLVGFMANRSPAVPKSRLAYHECQLLGPWRSGSRVRWCRKNAIEVPLPAAGDPPTVWTPTFGARSTDALSVF